jgi:hypothetical protein
MQNIQYKVYKKGNSAPIKNRISYYFYFINFIKRTNFNRRSVRLLPSSVFCYDGLNQQTK